MHSFSFGEIALIFGIVIILFGGSRLASIGKSLGEGIANFKKGLNGNDDDAQTSKKYTAQTSLQSTATSSYTPPQVSAHTQTDPIKSSNVNVIDVEQPKN